MTSNLPKSCQLQFFFRIHSHSIYFKVGTHMMAATLRQLGFATELVFGNLDWHLTEVQLLRGVHVAFALRYLAKAKVGLVGYHAPGMYVRKKSPS